MKWAVCIALLLTCFLEEQVDTGKFGWEKPKEIAPIIQLPEDFSFSFSIEDPFYISLRIDLSTNLKALKIHINCTYFSWIDSNYFDLANNSIYFKLMGEWNKFIFHDNLSFPEGLMQYINLWQLFAEYKGVINDLYSFSFPSIFDEQSRIFLYFDKAKMLKKIGSPTMYNNITFESFRKIENPNEYFTIPSNSKLVSEEEVQSIISLIKNTGKNYLKTFLGKSGSKFIDYFFEGPPQTDKL